MQVPFAMQGMDRFFDGTWDFGTAHVVHRHGRWFLHVPMTKDLPETVLGEIRQVVGLDFGINFLVTAYDSPGRTTFFSGRAVRRAHFPILRQTLQTDALRAEAPETLGSTRTPLDDRCEPSGQNHQVSQALVDQYRARTLFVLEVLTGLRGATERVRRRDRDTSVSWAFYQLRQMIESKYSASFPAIAELSNDAVGAGSLP